eukprot:CCRYP_017961-RA/>CCRYP_017961-RA protein AED:0.19 eAED:0.19 QI:0/-1/0/1/-1/1/1/0/839
MGVNGLLPCLQSITRTVPLEHYRGLTVAIDAMSWLHKGLFACDVKALARSQRIESEKCGSAELRCVKYALDKADILRAKFGMEVLMVIDGDSLPSKNEENAKRREDRENSFDKAVAAENAGDSRAARRFYAASISVTHKIRYELIKSCKQAHISFLVAPYEADAQMARLAHTGVVDLVITEDSDILAYGCPRALFKVDFEAYKGQEIQLMRDLGENEPLSFKNWTHDMFVFMCILSGCDYCRGVPGIGIKLSHKLVRVHRSPSKIFSALRAAGRMPLNFEDAFWVAFRTFRHQRVFCPSRQQIEPLFPIPGFSHDSSQSGVWPFLGEYIEPHIAARIADGTLHPSKKVEWAEALESVMDIQINLRSSSPSADRKQTRESRKQNKNTWHSLVYSNGKNGEHCQSLDQNALPTANLPVSNKDMFRFFSRNSKRDREDVRPPLKEIYVNGDTENCDSMQTETKETLSSQPGHKDLPIHFHEYKSFLVGNTFKPMSRKRLKRINDGTKSTECVQKIWEKSSRVPVDDKTIARNGCSADRGGIACFSKKKHPVAHAPCRPTTNDYSYTFTGGTSDEMNACLFLAHETAHHDSFPRIAHSQVHNNRSHESLSHYHRDDNESSYLNQHIGKYHYHHPKNVNDDEFLSSRHYEVCDHRDHLGARRNYKKQYNENHQDICDDLSHSNHQQRGLFWARHNDMKSLSSGYTTVEGSYSNECTELEYPAFYQELESRDREGKYCDFKHSFQSVIAVEHEDTIYRRKKNHNDRTGANENIGGFQLFQSYTESEQSDEQFCIGFHDNENENNHSLQAHNATVSCEGHGRSNRISTGPMFDDGLLVVFEEMQQL